MKQREITLCVAMLVAALLSAPSFASNEDCWKEGYQQGYCDAQGRNPSMCLPPLAPLPPLPQLGRDDCKSRFADGYREGLAAGAKGS